VTLTQRLRGFRSTEVGGLTADAFHVGIWQGAISIADFVQLALITHVLGLSELGRLALAMSFVVLVGQFFDVRVGAAATRFGAERLVRRDIAGLAGVFQLSYLVDAVTGVLGFVVVAGFAPLVGPRLVGANGTSLILLYACTLLISTVDESSVSALRVMDRFPLLAGYGVVLEILRVGMIGAALALSRSLTSVLLALVVYDLAAALTNLFVANGVFSRRYGSSLRRRSLSAFDRKRQMLRMVLHTNVVSYARLAQVQLPTLLVGALSAPSQVGLYKVGTAAGSIVGRLTDPGYAAVGPRFSRLWASGQIGEIRRIIRGSVLAASGVVGAALLTLIVLRDPILRLLGGGEGSAATTVLILVAIGQAVNGIFFWNSGLLYSAGRSGGVAAISVVGSLVQTVLLFVLVPSFAADGAAVALLVTLIATNIAATALCLRALRESPPPRPLSAGAVSTPQMDPYA
jgi:O-antigen/teichoic acid export membrane protein